MSSKKAQQEIEKIKFIYDKGDSKALYVNGAYGGMSPKGELICNFFFEYKDVPAEEIMPVADGKVQPKERIVVQRECEGDNELVLKRDIKAMLIIPASEVSTIANWMLDKLKQSQIVVEKEEQP